MLALVALTLHCCPSWWSVDMPTLLRVLIPTVILGTGLTVWAADPAPPDTAYRPLPTRPFSAVKATDEAEKAAVMRRQSALLAQRYDLADRPIAGVRMSAGRKAVQAGVRVKLPAGVTWDQLAAMTPDDIRTRGVFPAGFKPLPHVKQATGGQVFPNRQIDEIQAQEARNLRRFDVDFDLPDHLTPEFPPPIYLTTRPELGDVSRGQVLTIKNYYTIMNGILTPVQMEGLRLLLTPFPQEEFNQTEDRKSADQSLGVTCLDCHVNLHTNGAFHLTPDVRPQAARFRLDTTSLRGMFNQQIHGSKRSLRSVEDFTEFEQRTAYFNGDHVSATRKGVHLPDRPNQVAMMAQMQNIIDFPPAPSSIRAAASCPKKPANRSWRGSVFSSARVVAPNAIHRWRRSWTTPCTISRRSASTTSARSSTATSCAPTARSRRSRCAASRIRRPICTTAA
jgi:cytochrome c peroxidase